jgi:O-succinylbenzoic acid--CoA ligase
MAPEQLAIISPHKHWTYLQAHRAVETIRNDLKTRCSLKPDQRCAIIAGNSEVYVLTLIALWREGITPCLLSTRIPPQELERWVQRLSCQFVLHEFGSNNPCAFRIPERNMNMGDINLNLEGAFAGYEIFISPEQDATILLTSGSSGTPKAAVLTYGNHYFNALGSQDNLPFVPTDRWLLSLPLYHVSGLSLIFRVLLGGGSLVIPASHNDFIKALQHDQVTHVSLVTTQFFRLLKDPQGLELLKGLKAILLGGSAIPRPLLTQAIQHGLAVYPTYGLTEMASQVATGSALREKPQKSADHSSQSVNFREGGRVLPFGEVRLSVEGEILVRGKTRFKGYWMEDRLIIPFDEGGWFATGDLGQWDNKGRLLVTGRKDNMFISGGENIQPEIIERQLAAIDGIEEALVVPVAHWEYGQRPVAFIRFASSSFLTVEEIKRKLKAVLPSFMIPDRFYGWPESFVPAGAGMKPHRPDFIGLAESPEGRLVLLK